jgi:ornithine decarboxylase
MTNATILRFDRSVARHRTSAAGYASAAEFALAESPDDPVFCFSEDALRNQARVFQSGFPGEVAFAVKSNPSRQVIAGLHRAGIGVWDVASIQEMELVAGIAPEREFHYHNPVKSSSEIRTAYTRFGCRRFAVDCNEELNKIAGVIPIPAGIEIAVRFVLPRANGTSAHDFSSKFGVDVAAAASLLRRTSELGFSPLLTFHPGSQCKEPRAYVRHIEAAGAIAAAAHVPLAAVNVGGGFPARYATSRGAELEEFFTPIDRAMAHTFGKQRPKLECEPGRALSASSMSLLTRVKLVRNESNEIFLNDGVYGGLMEVWQAPELQPPHRVIRQGNWVAATPRLVTVYGPTCDPLDKLPKKLAVPSDVREGDYIEFGSLGAYAAATVTRFNGYGGHRIVPVSDVLNI